ncbi:MAG: glutathione S-transferase N-terminal domain-containing protein [Minisyncoccia bacterium]
MILYVKTHCPWCERVLEYARLHGITFDELRNKMDAGVQDELIARGGKSQFPYLVDGETEMYESGDIIEYLSKKFSTDNTAPEVKHKVCIPDLDL